MEKEKNNAVDKVENLTEKQSKTTSEKGGEKTKKSANKPKNDKKPTPTETVADEKIQMEMEREQGDREKRVAAAQRRREEKNERFMKKEKLMAEKAKAKKAKKAAAKKREEEYRKEKLRKKEERLARRDMLKHESREEKEQRLLAEREAKLEANREKRKHLLKVRAQKTKEKEEKRKEKNAAKQEKRRTRNEQRDKRRNRGIGGWLAAVISLASAVLILGTLFTLNLMDNAGMNMRSSSGVAESYYALTDYVDNIDVNISKLLVSKDEAQQQRLLNNITLDASLAAEDFSRLPLQDDQRFFTTKFINQVADFSKYLSGKLIDGGKISDEDRETLSSIYTINRTLNEELSSLTAEMGDDFDFNSVFDMSGKNMFLEKFVALESRAVEYPKLIYDGPFSDIESKPQPRGLSGEEITKKTAEEKFLKAFAPYNPMEVELLGETNGTIPCYNFKANGDDGEIYASLSKVGGKVIMFNYFKDCTRSNQSLDKLLTVAEDLIESMGIDGLSPVWATENEMTAYMNFCYNEGGIICYQDMVKITACKERGVVSAFDATAYYLNHVTRNIEEPKITASQAVKKVSSDIEVSSSRLALIPFGNNTELLAYEVSGTFDGVTYYVYIDAKTGHEAKIFRVVESTEGMLIM